jgi:2-oxoglutarate dehydrogenase E2 component (dihydrolipoamide succinyltransferase)
LKKILANEGDVVQVGTPIAVIETEVAEEQTNGSPKPEEPAQAKPETKKAKVEVTDIEHSGNGSSIPKSSGGRFYSPLVRNIAKKENISLKELEAIDGSGKEGRVTKHDILNYISTRELAEEASSRQPEVSPVQAPQPLFSGEDEIIEMDRMRKMIADRMVESKRTSPHVTSFVEADVSGIVKWRNKYKNEFKQRENEALTFTPIFLEAVVKAIKDYPMINVSVEGSKIIKRKAINIGMAVALPSGNLIVPVIHNADHYNIVGLAKKVNDLARRARDNKLLPDELQGGTYSISNVGSFGNVMGTPIIVQPQVAILALGAVQKKPSVIETPDGDFIGIRHKMFLSHSYDHRVVDGALGGMFVRRVADFLENFDTKRGLN